VKKRDCEETGAPTGGRGGRVKKPKDKRGAKGPATYLAAVGVAVKTEKKCKVREMEGKIMELARSNKRIYQSRRGGDWEERLRGLR